MSFIDFTAMLAAVGIAMFFSCAVLGVALYECHRHERDRREEDTDGDL